eukprot:m.218388 g.218388  ORF g.218388 m.218388 type:complete len:424 (+) comp39895_c2_seq15:1867-3138(+)
MQKMGKVTDDLKQLCDGIKRIVPYGADAFIQRNLANVQSLLCEVERVGRNMIRRIRLPLDQRDDMVGKEWKILRRLKNSSAVGEIAQVKMAAKRRVDGLAKALTRYLQSRDGLAFAHKAVKFLVHHSAKPDVQHVLKLRLLKAIFGSTEFQSFLKWADESLSPGVNDILLTHEIPEGDTDTVEMAGLLSKTFTKKVLEVGVRKIVLGKPDLGLSPAESSFVSTAISLIRSGRGLGLWIEKSSVMGQSIETNYENLVGSVRRKEELSRYLFHVLCVATPPFQALFTSIPKFIVDLEDDLNVISKAKESDVLDYRRVVDKCNEVQNDISVYILGLAVHEFAETEINWLNSKRPVAKGSFGEVFKVKLPGHRKAALKKMLQDVTNTNAEEFVIEMTVARGCNHPHIVTLYGSALFSPQSSSPWSGV